MDSYDLFIAGEKVKTGKQEKVFDKFSGEAFACVSVAGTDHIETAVAAAEKTKKTMANLPAHRRSRIIAGAAKIINRESEHFTELIIREAGKPYKFARAEVERCVENIEYAAEEAKRIHGETLPIDAGRAGEGKVGYYERFPAGVVLAISPFNFPLNLAAHKIAPAIAAGCPVILKPSSLTPLSGIELVRAFNEAGVPPGGIHALVGPGSTVGEALLKDKRISRISFTGSREVGERITRIAGIKKITLELGSNSGAVIDNNIDNMDFVVKRCVMGAFYYQGQVCISVQRIFVHKDIYDKFTREFVRLTKEWEIGNPLDRETDLGPMISVDEAKRVESWIDEAVDRGAKILLGGKREGNIYRPTVITDAGAEMKIMRKELFGPAVVIQKIDSFEQGVELCDNSEYGLQAGVFTCDINRAMKAVKNLDVGGVIINDIPTFRVDHMPYGGNKGSGLGREGAKFAIEEMTTLRMVVINLS
ncbi:MAG: aldehyde dehydrogenase family protein [Candidatus Aminicenantes bacterium]|nr:aldehyde dehydrogenase family protein [Candidatus Aminicenantes bacterium]